jgi:hypothetical protein
MRERALVARQRPDSLVRGALVALMVLSACGRPLWRSPLPSLSQEPRKPNEPIEAGIYALLLAEEDDRKVDHPLRYPVSLAESTIVDRSDSDELTDLDAGDSYLIEGRWPDSIKAGFAAALNHYRQRVRESHPVPPVALINQLVQFGPSDSTCFANRTPQCARFRTWVALSPVGFNEDSTYAVVYRRAWCGPLCATGIVFLFRRRPATQWTLWSARLLWIS